MKNEINTKPNPASKYLKNFRFGSKVFRFARIILGRHTVRPAHVINVDRIFYVTHRVSLSPGIPIVPF